MGRFHFFNKDVGYLKFLKLAENKHILESDHQALFKKLKRFMLDGMNRVYGLPRIPKI